eukprot:8781218-Pyramimonas_sp.AAC.1
MPLRLILLALPIPFSPSPLIVRYPSPCISSSPFPRFPSPCRRRRREGGRGRSNIRMTPRGRMNRSHGEEDMMEEKE